MKETGSSERKGQKISPTTHQWIHKGGEDVKLLLTTSALDGVSGQRHDSAALYRGEGPPSTHRTGGWVGPRAGLDTEATGKILLLLLGIEPRSPGRPARGQTLYLLSYEKNWY
jgi:hypothetical protein